MRYSIEQATGIEPDNRRIKTKPVIKGNLFRIRLVTGFFIAINDYFCQILTPENHILTKKVGTKVGLISKWVLTHIYYGYILILSREEHKEEMKMTNVNIKDKFPKKHQKYITDAYKEYNRYSVVIQFEDGFTRSIGGWNLAEVKDYAKQIIEVDRTIEF